jgi:dTDP-4-dehydrorhamnose 3,5-epimerase
MSKVTREPTMPDVLLIEPAFFGDDRGFFFESFNAAEFAEIVGHHVDFVQDNHSRSKRGVLRGLHFQAEPHVQGKLVRVIHGAVFDVAVDVRAGSATFGRWTGVELTADNRLHLWVPGGFAHGFLVLSEAAELLYKTTDYYAPACERAIRWDDPDIGITWPLEGAPQLSAKDTAAVGLQEVAPIASYSGADVSEGDQE